MSSVLTDAICEPPEQTAAEIAERLQARRGSVSGMARLFEHFGLIRRGTKAGDRTEHEWPSILDLLHETDTQPDAAAGRIYTRKEASA